MVANAGCKDLCLYQSCIAADAQWPKEHYSFTAAIGLTLSYSGKVNLMERLGGDHYLIMKALTDIRSFRLILQHDHSVFSWDDFATLAFSPELSPEDVARYCDPLVSRFPAFVAELYLRTSCEVIFTSV